MEGRRIERTMVIDGVVRRAQYARALVLEPRYRDAADHLARSRRR